MSDRIEQILEVLELVQAEHRRNRFSISIEAARLRASQEVAKRHGILESTVSDKFRRRLAPEIKGTGAFDRVLQDWLLNGSNELRSIMLRHAEDQRDRERIERFFGTEQVNHNSHTRSVSLTKQINNTPVTPKVRITVVLDEDVAEVFPDSDAVNRALRALINIMRDNAGHAK